MLNDTLHYLNQQSLFIIMHHYCTNHVFSPKSHSSQQTRPYSAIGLGFTLIKEPNVTMTIIKTMEAG